MATLLPLRCHPAIFHLLLIIAVLAVPSLGAAKPPKGVSLSYPPFSSSINCSIDGSVNTKPSSVCTPVDNRKQVIFGFDDVISARYQYKKKVPLWKKGSGYAASFSTVYTIEFRRSSDRQESNNLFSFGGGWAFAITPDQRVGSSGAESMGLFEIDPNTGNSLRGKATKTVAVELDISRGAPAPTFGDPQIPHLGLDINSVKSVAMASLGTFASILEKKMVVFLDYDASKELLQVRVQNLGPANTTATPSKSKAKLYLSRKIRLADYVNEESYVGFSSRVPQADDGVYVLYDWKFATVWVPVHK